MGVTCWDNGRFLSLSLKNYYCSRLYSLQVAVFMANCSIISIISTFTMGTGTKQVRPHARIESS